MHHRAGQRTRDPLDGLNASDDELAKLIDIGCLCLDDDVIRSGHIIRGVHTIDFPDCRCDLRCLPDFRLDEHISLDHEFSSRRSLPIDYTDRSYGRAWRLRPLTRPTGHHCPYGSNGQTGGRLLLRPRI